MNPYRQLVLPFSMARNPLIHAVGRAISSYRHHTRTLALTAALYSDKVA